ncbi:hypothetical protein M3J07_010040 [Ascochyta lentis]
MPTSFSTTTTSSIPPGLATPLSLAAAVPPPPAPPSMASDAQHPPPPPPHPRSLADWGRYYRVDVSIAHIEALCRGEQPTLALAYCDVVEHWLQLVGCLVGLLQGRDGNETASPPRLSSGDEDDNDNNDEEAHGLRSSVFGLGAFLGPEAMTTNKLPLLTGILPSLRS